MYSRPSVLITLLTVCSIVNAASESMILDGRYDFRTDSESLDIRGSQICFYPSGKSSKLVPRLSGDLRSKWFCFSNTEDAANRLKINLKARQGCGIEGKARVRVTNYVRYIDEGEGNDLATLQTVLRKSDLKTIQCVN